MNDVIVSGSGDECRGSNQTMSSATARGSTAMLKSALPKATAAVAAWGVDVEVKVAEAGGDTMDNANHQCCVEGASLVESCHGFC
jgi:hypothetical protein